MGSLDTNLIIRVSRDIKEKIEKKAKEQGMNPSQWVRNIILEKLSEPNEIEKIKEKIQEHEKRLTELEKIVKNKE